MGVLDKDAAVYIIADHGQHILNSFIYKEPNTNKHLTRNVYEVERMLPLFLMLVSKDVIDKGKNFRENLKINE